MCLYRTSVRNLLTTLIVLPLLSAPAWAQTESGASLAKIHIRNFGQTNEYYYRGAQPNGRDYANLAALGVKSVIDLANDSPAGESGLVQRAGMKFYRIPLTTTQRPSDAAVAEFLKLVNDPDNLPVYVHCEGGRHRTGVMTAVYRMTRDGWTANQAYQEMKEYHFETFLPHPQLKSFVFTYYAQLSHSLQTDKPNVGKAAGIPE